MIVPGIIGNVHSVSFREGGRPFAIGQLAPEKGYVHVLDDTSLDIVLRTLDTINDFTSYLSKKENLICGGKLIAAAGEDDLLAFYLGHLNEDGEHDFVMPADYDGMVIDEGLWEDFVQSPERQAQLVSNQISYSWDALIETFNKHILENTQYYTTHARIDTSEKIIRFFAREPRTRRRMLARSLIEFIENTPSSYKATRVILPSKQGDPFYVFLLLPHLQGVLYADYREVRRKLLEAYCLVTKLKFPEAMDIVGIATEAGASENRSEDAVYYDAREWGPEEQAEAQSLQKDLGLLNQTTRFQSTEKEYPV